MSDELRDRIEKIKFEEFLLKKKNKSPRKSLFKILFDPEIRLGINRGKFSDFFNSLEEGLGKKNKTKKK